MKRLYTVLCALILFAAFWLYAPPMPHPELPSASCPDLAFRLQALCDENRNTRIVTAIVGLAAGVTLGSAVDTLLARKP